MGVNEDKEKSTTARRIDVVLVADKFSTKKKKKKKKRKNISAADSADDEACRFENVNCLQPGSKCWLKIVGWKSWKGGGREGVIKAVEFGAIVDEDYYDDYDDDNGKIRTGWELVTSVKGEWITTGSSKLLWTRYGNGRYRKGDYCYVGRSWSYGNGGVATGMTKGCLDVGSGGWGKEKVRIPKWQGDHPASLSPKRDPFGDSLRSSAGVGLVQRHSSDRLHQHG
jgi:hypothetical protein